MNNEALFIFTAKRAANRPMYLASLIAIYCEGDSLTWDELAAQLQISSYQLAQLALCKRPNPANYNAEVVQIASYVGMVPFTLTRFLRGAENRETFQRKNGRNSFMAAQDRSNDE